MQGSYVQQETAFIIFDPIIFMSNSQTNNYKQYRQTCIE